MSNLTTNNSSNKPLQRSLFDLLPMLPIQVAQKWDFPLQHYETDSGILYAIQDWIAGLTNSNNVKASELWRQMKNETRISITTLDYLATDGKNYQRPFTNDKGLYLIAQNLRSTKQRIALEEIKKFLADAGAFVDEQRRKSESDKPLSKADAKRTREIEKHEKWGLGDRPEIIHLKSKADSIRTLETFKSLVNGLVDNPNWADIFNQEYIELFGKTAKEIIAINGGKSARENLPTLQLDTITFAEKRLIEILRMQKQGLSNERVLAAIELAVRPLGVYLRDLCDALGVNHISGKPLLSSGE